MAQILSRTGAVYTVFGLLGLISLLGCSTPHPQPELMIPEDISPAQRVKDTVCIHITGGADDMAHNPWGAPYLTKEAFAKAIDMSLVKAGLFNGVVSCDTGPQYQLDVFLVHAEAQQGSTIFSSSPASIVARWKLTNRANGQILINEEIMSTFVVGGVQSRKALEGAARDNIRQGLAHFAGL